MIEGIRRGDRLAILSKNSHDVVVVIFVAAKVGAVTIPINYTLSEKDIAYILNHAEVTAMFAAEEYITVLDAATEIAKVNMEYRYVLESDKQKGSWQPFAS